jgi:16S rRNA (cytosine1402-N4)-methyltransferase
MAEHVPVMLSEVMMGLNIKPNGIYLDATFGRGGHSSAILSALGPEGHLYALDQDPRAVEYGKQHIQDPRFTIVHGSFGELAKWVDWFDINAKVSGILMDLGVSSPQLDEAERGFSFMREGPLDMRMNTSCGMTAADYVNTASVDEMAEVFREYGEEKFAKKIARAIDEARKVTPILTTTQLAELVTAAQPRKDLFKHPATRVFQALRIKVNRELDVLKTALSVSEEALAKGGRLLVISFHSLEDKIVKNFLKHSEQGPVLPAHLPIPKELIHQPRLKKIGKPIKASLEEIEKNYRSRSAILRIGEKVS